MKKRLILLYFFALTIPFLLGVTAWQSSRYAALEREVKRLEDEQEVWIESNKRLIAGIAVLSSPERIEKIAKEELGLSKIRPEDVLQIRIDRERRSP
ncbi:MAG: septum formation initiator family protein [Spirochaetaceae bacterium]|jgi:cell division protein FtsL|nr:septum formation initiator family protein [Spirochaetaceae bacterium]